MTLTTNNSKKKQHSHFVQPILQQHDSHQKPKVLFQNKEKGNKLQYFSDRQSLCIYLNIHVHSRYSVRFFIASNFNLPVRYAVTVKFLSKKYEIKGNMFCDATIYIRRNKYRPMDCMYMYLVHVYVLVTDFEGNNLKRYKH